MIRGFEILEGYDGIALPTRKTAFSAGYDLAAAADVQRDSVRQCLGLRC